MKIRYKILVAPAIGMGLLLIFGGVSINAMRLQSDALEEIFVKRFGEFEFSAETTRRLDANRANVFRQFSLYESEFARYGQIDDAKAKKRNGEIITAIDDTTAKLAARGKASGASEQDREKYAAIAADLLKYDRQVAQALDQSTLDVGAAVRIMEGADEFYQGVYKKMAELVKSQRDQAAQSYASAQASVTTALIAAGVILALSIAVGGIVSIVIARGIMIPLAGARKAAARIAAGDLSVNLA